MEKRNGRIFRSRRVIAAGILLFFCMIMLIGCSTDETAGLEAQPQPGETTAPTQTSGPTLTPTSVPEAITFEGSGDQVIDLPEELSAVGVFHAVHQGSGDFVVRGYDTFGDPTEVFVDTTGPYDGRRLYFQYNAEKYPTRQFSIETEGAWEFTLYPFSEEYVALVNTPGVYTGTGDDVIGLQLPGDSVEVSATGEGRFMLWAHHEGRKDLAIDETAPFTGTVELPHLTVILEILAEGRYTLEISD